MKKIKIGLTLSFLLLTTSAIADAQKKPTAENFVLTCLIQQPPPVIIEFEDGEFFVTRMG